MAAKQLHGGQLLGDSLDPSVPSEWTIQTRARFATRLRFCYTAVFFMTAILNVKATLNLSRYQYTTLATYPGQYQLQHIIERRRSVTDELHGDGPCVWLFPLGGDVLRQSAPGQYRPLGHIRRVCLHHFSSMLSGARRPQRAKGLPRASTIGSQLTRPKSSCRLSTAWRPNCRGKGYAATSRSTRWHFLTCRKPSLRALAGHRMRRSNSGPRTSPAATRVRSKEPSYTVLKASTVCRRLCFWCALSKPAECALHCRDDGELGMTGRKIRDTT